MKILYYFVIFIVIIILCKLYIKIKYKFWAYQPVFHYYDFYYWVLEKGIINKDPPETNKFCNFFNVHTKKFDDLDKNTIKEIVGFIRTHYYRNKNADYLPTVESFSSYFIGNNSRTFISTYNKPYVIANKDLTTQTDNLLLGVMTGRPINITINESIKSNKSIKSKKSIRAHYIDFLCVHKDYRKSGIAPEIIQTHEYVQRHKNKKVSVSIFKREGELTGIVSLTKYNTYQFYIKNIRHERLPHSSMRLIEINKQNISLLINFIYEQNFKFECLILPDYTNLINLVNNTFIVYGIIENGKLISCYFFRDSFMTYDMRSEREKDLEPANKELRREKSIECFASLSNCHHNEIFIKGFTDSLYKYSKKSTATLVTIENISHNNIIVNYLLNIHPIIISPTAYFYYNYVKKPVLSEKAFIIC